MEKYNLHIVIVFYKKNIVESIAYKTLVKKAEKFNKMSINIIIWNNSPEIDIEKEDFIYYEGKNTTLPNIYNLLAKKYLNSYRDFLMISDDDTDYSNYDFEELEKILNQYSDKTGIFIPQLYAKNKLVSPSKRILFKGQYLDSVEHGFKTSKNTIGMNSGLIINYNCYRTMEFLFDERLNFYATDTDFFMRYEKYFDKLYILPIKIKHNLSSMDKGDKLAKFRLDDSIYGLKIANENKSFLEKILLFTYIFYLRIKGA